MNGSYALDMLGYMAAAARDEEIPVITMQKLR
jgi:hypothetical protein